MISLGALSSNLQICTVSLWNYFIKLKLKPKGLTWSDQLAMLSQITAGTFHLLQKHQATIMIETLHGAYPFVQLILTEHFHLSQWTSCWGRLFITGALSRTDESSKEAKPSTGARRGRTGIRTQAYSKNEPKTWPKWKCKESDHEHQQLLHF